MIMSRSCSRTQKLLGSAAVAVTFGVGALGTATAQSTDRAITIINPYSPGTASDIVARAFSIPFSEQLKQQVVVANRDGGSGVVGMTALAGSAPDGLTLAMTAMTPLVTHPHLVKNAKLSPKMVEPVCNVAENILGIAVREDSPFRTVKDLISAAHQKSLTYGSAGEYSIPRVGVERMKSAAGGEYVHLPFRGDPPSIMETLAGRTDFSSIAVLSGAANIRAGKLRLLGVFSNRRHPDFADIPTLEEQGVDAVQVSYTSLYAPAGTPDKVLDRLEAACAEAVKAADFVRLASSSGIVIQFKGRQELKTLLNNEYENFGTALKAMSVN